MLLRVWRMIYCSIIFVSASCSLIANHGDVPVAKKFYKTGLDRLYHRVYGYDVMAAINEALQTQSASKLSHELQQLYDKQVDQVIAHDLFFLKNMGHGDIWSVESDRPGRERLMFSCCIVYEGSTPLRYSHYERLILFNCGKLIMHYVQYLINNNYQQRKGTEDFFISVQHHEDYHQISMSLEATVSKKSIPQSTQDMCPQMFLLGCLGVTVGAFCLNELLEYTLL